MHGLICKQYCQLSIEEAVNIGRLLGWLLGSFPVTDHSFSDVPGPAQSREPSQAGPI
jgi:hypothetical protein